MRWHWLMLCDLHAWLGKHAWVVSILLLQEHSRMDTLGHHSCGNRRRSQHYRGLGRCSSWCSGMR
jgi:hypothetical protein